MMKKIYLLILVPVVLFCLCSCGQAAVDTDAEDAALPDGWPSDGYDNIPVLYGITVTSTEDYDTYIVIDFEDCDEDTAYDYCEKVKEMEWDAVADYELSGTYQINAGNTDNESLTFILYIEEGTGYIAYWPAE